MKNKIKYIIIGFIIFILLIISICFLYLNEYYKSSSVVNGYLKDSDSVKVKKIDSGYYFDGYGDDRLIIFYPGAKVETESYAILMNKLASNGIDTVLLDMPFRIAFLGINRSDSIISKYKYTNYTLMGHSLGGIAASSYLNNNDNNKIDSIIYLASYPNKKINNSINLLSIYGSNDKVLSIDSYNDSKSNFPKNSIEDIIEGGNHANFANYGVQKGDGKSLISRTRQQDLTVQYILKFVNELEG